MSDLWPRLLVVAGALLVAAAIALLQRVRARGPVRDLGSVDLEAGVYFFSSTACPTCEDARSRLLSRLGARGFVEHVWEDSPAIFSRLEVTSVPAVLIVDESGQGRLFPGKVDRAVAAVERAIGAA